MDKNQITFAMMKATDRFGKEFPEKVPEIAGSEYAKLAMRIAELAIAVFARNLVEEIEKR